MWKNAKSGEAFNIGCKWISICLSFQNFISDDIIIWECLYIYICSISCDCVWYVHCPTKKQKKRERENRCMGVSVSQLPRQSLACPCPMLLLLNSSIILFCILSTYGEEIQLSLRATAKLKEWSDIFHIFNLTCNSLTL